MSTQAQHVTVIYDYLLKRHGGLSARSRTRSPSPNVSRSPMPRRSRSRELTQNSRTRSPGPKSPTASQKPKNSLFPIYETFKKGKNLQQRFDYQVRLNGAANDSGFSSSTSNSAGGGFTMKRSSSAPRLPRGERRVEKPMTPQPYHNQRDRGEDTRRCHSTSYGMFNRGRTNQVASQRLVKFVRNLVNCVGDYPTELM